MATTAFTQEYSQQQQLTKPPNWASFMVTAALKFASDQTLPTAYSSADEARLEILNMLNWYEAHDEYEWPDFARLGFNFSQGMRFRRALVNDVFVALKIAGNMQIVQILGRTGTLESGVVRATKRSVASSQCMAERKRHCKREEASDTDTNAGSDASNKELWEQEGFLAQLMRHVLGAGDVNLAVLLENNTADLPDTHRELTKIVRSAIVEKWNGPPSGPAGLTAALREKQDIWARENSSLHVEARPCCGEQRESERVSDTLKPTSSDSQ